MNIKDVLEQAKIQLSEATGLKIITIVEIFKDERGWHVFLDMLEMSRIPPATDVLGEYEVILDNEGNMLSFERKRTRLRGQCVEREGKLKV